MTPTQLSHLRAIDAHLAKLLNIAAKRTPGEWNTESDWPRVMCGARQIVQVPTRLTFATKGPKTADTTFIASCAGNAEAGWIATRAAIAAALQLQSVSLSPCNGGSCMVATDAEDALEGMVNTFVESILAAFPLERIEA